MYFQFSAEYQDSSQSVGTETYKFAFIVLRNIFYFSILHVKSCNVSNIDLQEKIK